MAPGKSDQDGKGSVSIPAVFLFDFQNTGEKSMKTAIKNGMIPSIFSLFLMFLLIFPGKTFAVSRTATTLATETNLTTNIDREIGGVQIGTVMAWPYATLPAGGCWLECNGQAISATAYPEFVAFYGSVLPDYRGYFLRGLGGKSAALNVAQGDGVRSLSGSDVLGSFESGDNVYEATGAFRSYSVRKGGGNSNGKDGGSRPHVELRVSGMFPSANEVRPVNKAVKYIIKVR